ncbi:hypothetical protein [Virgibacillus kimchii]
MSFVYKSLIGVVSLCIIISIITFLWLPFYSFKGFEKALDGVLLLSSIGLGFYGACLSVLASIFNTKAVKEIMNDNEYRKEFIVLSLSTLIISFFTVLTTIVYQVLLENEGFSNFGMGLINAFWVGATSGFIMLNILFILVSFMIFFANES